MTDSVLSIGLSLVFGIGLLAGCVQQKPQDVQMSEVTSDSAEAPIARLPAAFQTVKPGASVSMSHDLSGPVRPGQNGSVNITLNEGYPSGTLTVSARGSDGLSVFGADTTRRLDMSAGTTHTLQLTYQAENDGVYYINLMANADPEPGVSEARAFAIRVEIGDWKTAESKRAKPAMETLPDGQRAVIMNAEETTD